MNEEKIIWDGNNVPISVVAKAMRKNEEFVRLAIQQGLFDFGIALKKKGQEQYDYYVSPKKLYEYCGYIYNSKESA